MEESLLQAYMALGPEGIPEVPGLHLALRAYSLWRYSWFSELVETMYHTSKLHATGSLGLYSLGIVNIRKVWNS